MIACRSMARPSLSAGEELPLRRPLPANGAAAATTLALARGVLDEFGGGPLLLSRLFSMLYDRGGETARAEVRGAGGPMAWCDNNGILRASGPKGSVGMETAWLAKTDALEVDSLLWLPWILLATRRDYTEPIPLRSRNDLRVHPYFARVLMGTTGMLNAHFRRVGRQAKRR